VRRHQPAGRSGCEAFHCSCAAAMDTSAAASTAVFVEEKPRSIGRCIWQGFVDACDVVTPIKCLYLYVVFVGHEGVAVLPPFFPHLLPTLWLSRAYNVQACASPTLTPLPYGSFLLGTRAG